MGDVMTKTEVLQIQATVAGSWKIADSHEELRARLERAERERDEVRTWAERARDTIADYRRAYGTDHRNQELADALDERAVGVLRDWRLGNFEPVRVALGAAGEEQKR